jgi:hypothetical protein
MLKVGCWKLLKLHKLSRKMYKPENYKVLLPLMGEFTIWNKNLIDRQFYELIIYKL